MIGCKVYIKCMVQSEHRFSSVEWVRSSDKDMSYDKLPRKKAV